MPIARASASTPNPRAGDSERRRNRVDYPQVSYIEAEGPDRHPSGSRIPGREIGGNLPKSSAAFEPRRLSELSPPRLATSAFARKHRYRLLGQALHADPALQVHGPAGAGKALPTFDPRFAHDPERFVPGFFQAYFNALAPGNVVVLDDYRHTEPFIEELGRAFNSYALLNRCVYHDTRAILHIHDTPISSKYTQW